MPVVVLVPPPPYCFVQQMVPLHRPQMVHHSPPPVLLLRGCGSTAAAEVRDVWAANLDDEFSRIAALLPRYPCVHVDTEFPGTVHESATPRQLRGPRESYAVVRRNVDELKLLQVGIALSSGPAGRRCPVAWQLNLRGFDARRDPHAAASVAMLRAQGMDLGLLREFGAAPEAFAAGFFRSGLGCGRLTWAAFSGSYDFAFLAKVLGGGRPLPATVEGFLAHVRHLFGPAVLDVKRLARFCGKGGMRGGLDQVAAALGVDRAAGRAHCAGSDSLLTCDVLLAMVDRSFRDKDVLVHAGAIEGLV
jgi:CCR4-NOT transcription complex subunit 7/8